MRGLNRDMPESWGGHYKSGLSFSMTERQLEVVLSALQLCELPSVQGELDGVYKSLKTQFKAQI